MTAVFAGLLVSSPRAPDHLPPEYFIGTSGTPGHEFEVTVPSIVYPNGTVVPFRGMSITGNGTIENTSTPLGPAFLVRGNGTVWVTVAYGFSGSAGGTVRFSGGLPDLSQWTGPDTAQNDTSLGTVRVRVSTVPPGGTVTIFFGLTYNERSLRHLSYQTALPEGQHDLEIRTGGGEGTPPDDPIPLIFVGVGGLVASFVGLAAWRHRRRQR